MKRQDFEKMIELIQDVNSKKQFANTDENKLDSSAPFSLL